MLPNTGEKVLRAFWTLPPTLSHLLFLLFRRGGGKNFGMEVFTSPCCHVLGFSWSLFWACEYHSWNGERYWLPGELRHSCLPWGWDSITQTLLITKERRQNKHEKGLPCSSSTFHSYLAFFSLSNFPPCFHTSVFVTHTPSLRWDIFQRSIYFLFTTEKKKAFLLKLAFQWSFIFLWHNFSFFLIIFIFPYSLIRLFYFVSCPILLPHFL